MRGFIIIMLVSLFFLWVFLCIRYKRKAAKFIQVTFEKFIGRDEEKNDVK